jgi:hypothetical protein
MLKSIIAQYKDQFKLKYAGKLLPSHFKALNAISTCRTPEAGELYVHCPECNHAEHKPLSCGNRNCPICQNVPAKWVVDCSRVGQGITALKYLSRYLYRGVISEKNIIFNKNGKITFKYIESKTKKIKHRTLDGEDFLYLIMQHVLPKGFRRARDYGFLHGNAKKLLFLVQLVLHVSIKLIKHRPRPVFKCPCCKSPMKILGVCSSAFASG